jgi:DNA-binding XRE family transcriptional regulator
MKTANQLTQYLKMLRVKNDETGDVMASRIGVSGAYLFNMEKKGIMPAEMVRRLVQSYALGTEEKNKLVEIISNEVVKKFWEKV